MGVGVTVGLKSEYPAVAGGLNTTPPLLWDAAPGNFDDLGGTFDAPTP
jgi:hypothetical protein